MSRESQNMAPYSLSYRAGISLYSGWSSCSGTAESTGLYATSDCCLLQINHVPEAANPSIKITKHATSIIK